MRAMISGLKSGKVTFYQRNGELYIDTMGCGGTELLALEQSPFMNFMLDLAYTTENLLLKAVDVEQIVNQVRTYAAREAIPLSSDPRSCMIDGILWINPGWESGELIKIEGGAWEVVASPGRIFAPLPASMAMAHPIHVPATDLPGYLTKGIVSFGEFHCFFSTLAATMLMPSDDVHPVIILSGEGAKGKTTTMKLMTQLVDPDEGNECISVGEDPRDLLVTCLYRKMIGLDNASKLPISDDILSQMYTGGTRRERKLHTNNELSETKIGRMRIFINGVAPGFSKSDFFTKAIFLDQPAVTVKDENGVDRFTSLSAVERDWKAMLPLVLGALLGTIAAGLPHYQAWMARREAEDRRADASVRFVEFAVMGEAFSRAMGFPEDEFTKQIDVLDKRSKVVAKEGDEVASLMLSLLNGEVEGAYQQLANF